MDQQNNPTQPIQPQAQPPTQPVQSAQPIQPPPTLEGESLGEEAVHDNMSLDQIEKAKRRITHFDNSLDALALVKDIKFERIMFAVGMGLIVALTIIGFTFYNTIEVRQQNESIASQVEADFYARLLKDKAYVFNYRIESGVKQYDPLSNAISSVNSAQGLGDVDSNSRGGYSVNNGEQAQILDSSGQVVLELGDPSIYIGDLLLAPDGNSVVFDVFPASVAAENKFGLRLGAYEYKVGGDEFTTLVSDASPGKDSEDYLSHFVQVLSFSPNGRYLAYTNRSALFLYDRLSHASIRITDLDSVTQEPETAWNERASVELLPATDIED